METAQVLSFSLLVLRYCILELGTSPHAARFSHMGGRTHRPPPPHLAQHLTVIIPASRASHFSRQSIQAKPLRKAIIIMFGQSISSNYVYIYYWDENKSNNLWWEIRASSDRLQN